jgi:hypothetical protein
MEPPDASAGNGNSNSSKGMLKQGLYLRTPPAAAAPASTPALRVAQKLPAAGGVLRTFLRCSCALRTHAACRE